MEFFEAEDGGSARLAGTTLVLPAISVGNAGQLAIDLIITGLKLKRVGSLEEPNVLPCVGNDAVGLTSEGVMSTSLEVYLGSSPSITLIQQRAPNAPGLLKAFVQNLSEFVKETGFKNVVILSGLDAGKQRGGLSLPERRVRYIATSASGGQSEAATSADVGSGLAKRCQELGWPVLEEFTQAEGEAERVGVNGDQASSSGGPSSNGGTSYGSMFGVETAGPPELERGQWWGREKAYQRTAFWKMSEALKDCGVNVLSLLLLCSEGDNVPDGLALATALDSLLGLRNASRQGDEPRAWDIPISWASIYGPPPDTSLFG